MELYEQMERNVLLEDDYYNGNIMFRCGGDELIALKKSQGKKLIDKIRRRSKYV